MTQLHAQPYDLSAYGFYFESEAEFNDKASKARNDYGQPVEEFEIQFIEGDGIDCELFEALSVNQCNLAGYFQAVDEWDEDDKVRVILHLREGMQFDLEAHDPKCDFLMDFYEDMTMRELAEEFVNDGVFGEIPKSLEYYLDYDAIARDLCADYSEASVNGKNYIYRCD
ncbi:antirestriction protein ArdA [Asticcacaulis sp. SL142]|uniref:antirestriction protein ArdA n=1 Tax=Asticcacaulis sp. SL142 TaxID=2995155 RepID=UPI00226D3711|nr:antirestriction protein ArdA [Asticcacaulis sp. SL142]WAC47567.1 antirestriction protein ArdA [Asticcacaulis sp. SL142]